MTNSMETVSWTAFFMCLGFALFGLCAAVFMTWQWLRDRLRRRLNARHAKLCAELNRRWTRRIVRHARTGQVGMVLGLCSDRTWRDLWRPRWLVGVVIRPETAALFHRPSNSLEEAMMRGGMIAHGLANGGSRQWLLDELTLAPSGDAEEFRAAMERSEHE